MVYEEKTMEHFTAHVRITRTRKSRAALPRDDKRDSVTLAEVTIQADTLDALTRKLRGHITLVEESDGVDA